mgnify:CR=1 FL=1
MSGLNNNEFRLHQFSVEVCDIIRQIPAGKVLTYDYIINELWGPRAGGDNQILRVNMANIRRKIEKNPAAPEYIFTEIGVGYRMLENDA